MYKNTIFIFTLITFLGIACKSTKQNTTTGLSTAQVKEIQSTVNVKDTLQKNDIYYTELQQSAIDFNTASIRLKVNYDFKNDAKQFNATVRIEKNKKIWISITGPLGIEPLRILATPDSLFMLNHLNNTVTIKDIHFLQTLTETPIRFEELQDILIGNPLLFQNNIINRGQKIENLITLLLENNTVINALAYKQQHKQLSQYTSILTNKGTSNKEMKLYYNAYQVINQQAIPFARKIELQLNEDNGYLEMEVKKIELNTALSFPFSIPKNYKRI